MHVFILLKEAFWWNEMNIKRIFSSFFAPHTADVPYAVFFVSFIGFVIHLFSWIQHRHTQVSEVSSNPSKCVTCHAEEASSDTLHSNIHTIADIRK